MMPLTKVTDVSFQRSENKTAAQRLAAEDAHPESA